MYEISTWHTERDFLLDLDKYAEYTRPKIDENGEVICNTPVPDTLKRFFTDANDEISSKEKQKHTEVDSDKDVDESSFEKRDKSKDSTEEVEKMVPKHNKYKKDCVKFHEAKGHVPQRAAWPGAIKHYNQPKSTNVPQEEPYEEFLEAKGYVPQRVPWFGANKPSHSHHQHQPRSTNTREMPWTAKPSNRNSNGRGRGQLYNPNNKNSNIIFVPAGMPIPLPKPNRRK